MSFLERVSFGKCLSIWPNSRTSFLKWVSCGKRLSVWPNSCMSFLKRVSCGKCLCICLAKLLHISPIQVCFSLPVPDVSQLPNQLSSSSSSTSKSIIILIFLNFLINHHPHFPKLPQLPNQSSSSFSSTFSTSSFSFLGSDPAEANDLNFHICRNFSSFSLVPPSFEAQILASRLKSQP